MNVNIDAKNIGDVAKKIPYKVILLLISVVSALLIFLPDVILKEMFLLELRNTVGTFLGLLFIFSTCLSIYVVLLPPLRRRRIKRAFSGERARKKIENLSSTEKRIIAYMFRHQGSSISLPGNCTAVIRLKNLLMISISSNYGTQVHNIQFFPYFLQQWVSDALEANPDLIKGISDRLPEEIENQLTLL